MKCSLAILEGFVRRLPRKVALPIEFVQEREGGLILVTYQVVVEGGMLGLCAELQPLARHSLRSPSSNTPGALGNDGRNTRTPVPNVRKLICLCP